jgi:hypothetical protein
VTELAEMLYDVFISHASEDKDEFVRPLASLLKENHLEVWYDEFSLKVGDSLRRSIDRGLSRSRFGVVVISPHFISKEWPQWELDGLVQRQMDEKRRLILPVWHEVGRREVLAFCPPLADKVAVSSLRGLEHVARQLLHTIKPQGSTLLVARDRLIELGFEPPVVTDDWWLDLVEFSAGNDAEETWQEQMGWGHWGFPLPPRSTVPSEKGERLAIAAAQRSWQEAARHQRICQVTPPDRVWEFIESQPGLMDACTSNAAYLAAYAPQLTIPGFGRALEDVFEAGYQRSLAEHARLRAERSRQGTALTTNGLVPACDESVAMRHPTFGDYQPEHLAGWYVHGHMLGPPVQVYDNIDYALWLLSDESMWLPDSVRNVLLVGMRDQAMWDWDESAANSYRFAEYTPVKTTGSLFRSLFRASERRAGRTEFQLTGRCVADIGHRFGFSAQVLSLPESVDVLLERFSAAGFVESWLTARTRRRKRATS